MESLPGGRAGGVAGSGVSVGHDRSHGWNDFGKIGLPEALGVSPWVIIPLFWTGTIALFWWFEKRKL